MQAVFVGSVFVNALVCGRMRGEVNTDHGLRGEYIIASSDSLVDIGKQYSAIT